jgi:hypothetical protein
VREITREQDGSFLFLAVRLRAELDDPNGAPQLSAAAAQGPGVSQPQALKRLGLGLPLGELLNLEAILRSRRVLTLQLEVIVGPLAPNTFGCALTHPQMA